MKGGGPVKLLATAGAVIFGGIVGMSMISSVAIRGVQTVVDSRRRKTAPACDVCRGRRFLPCKLCKGNSVIYWSPLLDPVGAKPCLCPTCEGNKVQRCLNCVGKCYS